MNVASPRAVPPTASTAPDWEAAALGPRHDSRPMRRGVWAPREEEEAWLQASVEARGVGESGESGNGVGLAIRTSPKRTQTKAAAAAAAEEEEEEDNNCESASGAAGIPKIIHQIWLGSARPSSPRYEAWFASWTTYHPSWTVRWWHDADVVALKQSGAFRNSRAFAAAENYGEKSDILRYEILLKYGGVYVDTDMECLASFESLHGGSSGGSSGGSRNGNEDGRVSFYTGYSNTATVELNNGIFGSVPGHPILEKLVQAIADAPLRGVGTRAPGATGFVGDGGMGLQGILTGGISGGSGNSNNVNALLAGMLGGGAANANLAEALKPTTPFKWDKCMSTIERTGPGLFTRTVLEFLVSAKCRESAEEGAARGAVVVLPTRAFYPVPNTVGTITPDILSECTHRGLTLAVHHWAKSWQTGEINT
jgi:hypothetical protein